MTITAFIENKKQKGTYFVEFRLSRNLSLRSKESLSKNRLCRTLGKTPKLFDDILAKSKKKSSS